MEQNSTFNASPRQAALAQRLQPLARWVRGLLLLGGPLIGCMPLWLLFAPQGLLLAVLSGALVSSCDAAQAALLAHGVSEAVRWRLAGASLLPAGIWLLAVWQLWALFGQYRQGAVFSAQALASLRRLGWSLVAMFAARPIYGALVSVALSWDNPPGQRQLTLSFSSDDYVLLLFALLLLAIAKVMQEAARAAEENEGFV